MTMKWLSKDKNSRDEYLIKEHDIDKVVEKIVSSYQRACRAAEWHNSFKPTTDIRKVH
jgi:hypothetical protein